MLKEIGYLPVFIGIAITLLTIFLFLKSIAKSTLENPAHTGKRIMIFLFFWLALQAAWGFSGFYANFTELPPHIFLYGVGPAFLFILAVLVFSPWRKGMLKLDLESLTWIHVVRIPVELGLFLLYQLKTIPEEMTFSGRNFDILSGLTAPLMIWLIFKKRSAGKNALIAWNLICLALLVNIVLTAVFSMPYPFQKFGMLQPNKAVFAFPFVWLPTVIVPVVLFSHIASLFKLLSKEHSLKQK
ncbi:MAG: hypothetical protein IAF38_16780 [Bacteroidia bacterium]|nr:hypothetical protein [Bacteroidia bacterium]